MIRDQFEEVVAAYQLAIAHGEPDALKRYCSLYPHFEEQLLRFALRDAAVPTGATEAELAPFRGMLTPALQHRALAAVLEDDVFALSGIFSRAAKLGLDPRALAATVNLPRDLLMLLDSRAVVAASVPRRCLSTLAEALETTVGALREFLSNGTVAPTPAFHFAPSAPEASAPQTFAEALAQSALASAAQRAYWQSILEDEQTAG